VSQLNGLRDDLYVVVGAIDPESKRATFRVHVNPLVAFIWIGVLVLILGASVSLWPDVSLREVGAWGYVRASAGLTSSVIFAILLASTSASAVENDRDRISRQRAVPMESRPSASSPAAEASLRDVTRRGGFSILGGLLLGATVAWAARSRRKALAR
jgi:hypothetical protein